MAATLFVVATPIGNLEDLSPRARQALEEADWIACEDTRHSGRLLARFGIETPTISYHDHNEEQRSLELLERLRAGEAGALISDAGTPLISDPGFRLVRLCREEEIPVTAVPGPSAGVAAASISGLPCSRVLLAGFPPRKAGEAERFFRDLAASSATLVCYLSPHRLRRDLGLCLRAFGTRRAFLARELTKLHEQTWFSTLEQLSESDDLEPARGEYTLVVDGTSDRSAPEGPPIDVAAYLEGLRVLHGASRSEALKKASRELGIPRNRLYEML